MGISFMILLIMDTSKSGFLNRKVCTFLKKNNEYKIAINQ